jgi:transcriptional regulator with XRE-family HTH domain
MTFRPELLKGLREAKGWTQPELAKKAGLSQSAITKAEKGKTGLSGDGAVKLAIALDCTTDYLFGLGEKFPSHSDAAARMSFDVFARDSTLTVTQKELCKRVLVHRDAPKTAASWRTYLEMFELSADRRIHDRSRNTRKVRR